ncbi:MAG TPA: hypothetical protein VG186_05225 [Solirubrobacteraceae bacterium]|jgi:hypothetical protein|nr:hypothetical protein [Solirubrobacteraceae bacterium]
MVVALLALFASLGGVGYAATNLPANSVGTTQLRNASVTNHKILNGSVGNFKLSFGAVGPRKMENGAVGTAQINTSQVQSRVTGTCTAGAVTSVTTTGAVACSSAPGLEFDTSSSTPVTVPAGTAATAVTTEPLPGGSSYLVTANPYVHVTGATAGQQVEVDCTLAAGPATTAVQTRSWTTEIGANALPQTNSIPLVITVPSSANSITAGVACTRSITGTETTTPAVTVSTNINAIQTASNTTTTHAR